MSDSSSRSSSSSSSSHRYPRDSLRMVVEEMDYFRKTRSAQVLRQMNMPNKSHPKSIAEQERSVIVREQEDMDGYQQVISRANHMFPSETRMTHLLKVVRSLPVGYRTTLDLRGVPLGYLCARLTQSERHSNILHGLYLTGVLRDFSTYMTEDHEGDEEEERRRGRRGGGGSITKTVYRSVDQLHIKEFPLWKVESFDPQDTDVLYGRSANMSFEKYLEECIATKGGSDMNCYFMWDRCSIARRSQPPQYLERNVFVTRTAGLSHIITRSFETTFTFLDTVYHVYIPDGLENCFQQAVRYGYLKKYEQLYGGKDNFVFEPAQEGSIFYHADVDSSHHAPSYSEVLRSPYRVKEEFIDALFEKIEKRRVGGCGGNPIGSTKELKRRERVLQHGFSMYEMNRRAEIMVQEGCIIPLVYRVNGSAQFPYMKNFCTANAKSPHANAFLSESLYDYVSVMLMTDTGQILDPMRHKQYISSFSARGMIDPASGLLHAIGIYPTIEENSFPDYDTQVAFVRTLEEKVLAPFMDAMYTESTYCVGGESYDPREVRRILYDIVDIQNERYERGLTNTLIFHTKKEEKKGPASKQQKRYIATRAAEGVNAPTRTLLVAYDIETVYNDIIDPDEMNRRVWAPFQKNHEILETGEYLPLDAQIPYCVQWVPVDARDTPACIAKKSVLDITVRKENFHSMDVLFQIPLSDGVTCVDEIILQPPRVVYGDCLLGKCVNDFLLEVAKFAVDHQYKTVYCYAHNGVSFDSYIVLQYCLFPVKKILKTSRGILSMTIMVPVVAGGGTVDDDYGILHEDEDGMGASSHSSIAIHFRDTRVHIAGSLKNICKSFKVPPEWVKLDFPITMVNSHNCYLPAIVRIAEPYAVNDVLCLAFIIKKLNESLMDSEWEPADIYDDRPPIVQFLTCMSMVKAATLNHFRKTLGSDRRIACHALDLPSLRHWVQEATMGGRVGAYARTYVSPFWKDIYAAYMRSDQAELSVLYQNMVLDQACMRVLDVTSLYPFAQSHCPLPTGDLRFVSARECHEAIDSVYCGDCIESRTLCTRHRDTSLESDNPNCMHPFVIVLVHKLSVREENRQASVRNMCGRKLYKTGGLEYSLETPEEIMARLGTAEQRSIQSYTHIDLFWMKRQGFTFEIICGIGWSTSYIYSDFIKPAFYKRIEAKKSGNKVLSEMLKLMYNSAYGVTTQRDISESAFITTLPAQLRHRCVSDQEVVKHLLKNSAAQIGPDEELDESITFPSGQTYIKKKKKKHINEFYGEQSPMHIGAAILAYSRHIMNLLMFQYAPTLMTYTDTDSICIAESIAASPELSRTGLICDRDDAFMGTYKNDHHEGPHGEPNLGARVVLSFIGTKKVKMHITLNPKGELKIFNTFKGLNPANHLPGEKSHMHPDFVDKIITDSLIYIGLEGGAPDVSVTHWKRDLAHGVSISDHPQVSKRETYLGHSQGSRLAHAPQGYTEMFIPFGHPLCRPGDFIPYMEYPSGVLQDDPNRLSVLCDTWGFSSPDQVVSDMLALSEKYYSKANEKNQMDDPEYAEYVRIFESVAGGQ